MSSTDRTEPGPNDPIRQIPRSGPATDVARPKGILAAHAALIAKLAQLKPNVIRLSADPVDFENRRDHLREVAAAVDAYILALGEDSRTNNSDIDIAVFMDVVSEAIDGMAEHELASAAERIRDERYEGCSARGPFYRARP